MRQQTGPDTYVDAVEHPLYEILNALPNPEMTAYQFKAFLQWQLLTFGVAYAEIVRVDGRVDSLWPLDATYMRVDRIAATRQKRWTYAVPWNTAARTAPGGKQAGQVLTWLFDASQPPILELFVVRRSINRCREIIGSALAPAIRREIFCEWRETVGRMNSRPASLIPPTISRRLRRQ